MSDFAITALGGALSAVGTLVDSIVVLSLAIFMAVDRDGILRLGLDLTPPDKREDVLMFRRSVASAAAGFIRSQLILGAVYGVWAFVTAIGEGSMAVRLVFDRLEDSGAPVLAPLHALDAAAGKS
jgi:predicted PurR-regulated permease PerM